MPSPLSCFLVHRLLEGMATGAPPSVGLTIRNRGRQRRGEGREAELVRAKGGGGKKGARLGRAGSCAGGRKGQEGPSRAQIPHEKEKRGQVKPILIQPDPINFLKFFN